jgi:predicted nucleotidyltransferase component of viral defense system
VITKRILEERVRAWQLREDVVEKDYVLGWLLWGIGSHDSLSATWAFKGGTALKKCYVETYRFSEDLDFTVLPGGPVAQDELATILDDVLSRVGDESGINFGGRRPVLKTHPSGLYTEGRIYYQGPRNAPQVASVKLDLSASEQVVRPTVMRPIVHDYPDILPKPATVRCYSFEEVFAEKIRAMGERGRPRDLYDIVYLHRRFDLGAQPDVVRAVLAEKCETKGVPVPTLDALANADTRAELESEWANMLAHQLPALPPFSSVWEELPQLFAWLSLQRDAVPARLLPAGPWTREAAPPAPPVPAPTPAWSAQVPLEAIRFAAANRLCVRLGYGGSVRIVEPYALRESQEGHGLLHAIRLDSREHRSYRVDRIESVSVTNQTFTPVYQIELATTGPVVVPASARPRRSRLT